MLKEQTKGHMLKMAATLENLDLMEEGPCEDPTLINENVETGTTYSLLEMELCGESELLGPLIPLPTNLPEMETKNRQFGKSPKQAHDNKEIHEGFKELTRS